ncbi:DKNYY domain-containing protein [Aquabacterium sp.]|uniref:DKNYY domain-containing protein n=1 Tax=Aquabacterium sp. TaxID=1872578 RepID=UPI002D0582E0|nr:DKNYY domain-containing protein [Aquabacterium sp.]HSW05579.1 DKNYY domain-containing protein [Aquabacterium sp.]
MLRFAAGLMLLSGLAWLCGCDSREPYQRKDGHWAFEDRPLGDGRVDQLSVLNRRFAKTATQAFYRHAPIDEADAASFEALDEHHARDRHRVYHADTYRDSQDYFTTQRIRLKVLADADPASFRLLEQGYARDAHHLYFDGQAFAVRDVASFEVLEHGFARDQHSGYYLRAPVRDSDGSRFEVLAPHYAKDARHAFFADLDYRRSGPARVRTRRLTGAELATFKVLERGYAVDAGRVYWEGEPVPGADSASFSLLPSSTGDADAHDAQRRYQRGRPLAS